MFCQRLWLCKIIIDYRWHCIILINFWVVIHPQWNTVSVPYLLALVTLDISKSTFTWHMTLSITVKTFVKRLCFTVIFLILPFCPFSTCIWLKSESTKLFPCSSFPSFCAHSIYNEVSNAFSLVEFFPESNCFWICLFCKPHTSLSHSVFQVGLQKHNVLRIFLVWHWILWHFPLLFNHAYVTETSLQWQGSVFKCPFNSVQHTS